MQNTNFTYKKQQQHKNRTPSGACKTTTLPQQKLAEYAKCQPYQQKVAEHQNTNLIMTKTSRVARTPTCKPPTTNFT